MAQYKVPQDVEADDKLIGPFSFRQFVYLMVSAGLIALSVGLFQLFPLLAIIPLPFTFFFLALALPLKKDQPMETYLAAIVSFYLKPHTKFWMPGQKESTILITAPKKVEEKRTRDITGEEATHRLSFLADIVDTEGYAIKGAGASPMREDLVAEAEATPDMFEAYQSQVINRVIDQDKMSRHNDAVTEMRNAIERNNMNMQANLDEPVTSTEHTIARPMAPQPQEPVNVKAEPEVIMPTVEPEKPAEEIYEPKLEGLRADAILQPDVEIENSDVVVRPEMDFGKSDVFKKVRVPGGEKPGFDEDIEDAEAVEEPKEAKPAEKASTKPINNSIIELAHNKDFSVATIAKEANRIKRKEEGEIFVSLH